MVSDFYNFTTEISTSSSHRIKLKILQERCTQIFLFSQKRLETGTSFSLMCLILRFLPNLSNLTKFNKNTY